MAHPTASPITQAGIPLRLAQSKHHNIVVDFLDIDFIAPSLLGRSAFLVKAHTKPADKKYGWHWNKFFASRARLYDWGGPEWIRSPLSRKNIERMRKGDLIVAYQVDSGAIVGFAEAASNGRRCPEQGCFCDFDLSTKNRTRLGKAGLKLEGPQRALIRCLTSGHGRGTVHALSAHEAEIIAQLASLEFPRLRSSISRALAGIKPAARASPHRLT